LAYDFFGLGLAYRLKKEAWRTSNGAWRSRKRLKKGSFDKYTAFLSPMQKQAKKGDKT
jgi:hypothetical protein